jgi:hypothetical protein
MKIMKLACLAVLTIALLSSPTLTREAAAGQEGATSKKVTVACFDKDGKPVGGCDVEFWTQNYHYKHRCVTAASGICQTILECCGPKGDPPQLMWRIKGTSVHGQKDGGYFWSSCGWQCGESKYIRIEFK